MMVWDESKHPRAKDGKFTDGTGQSREARLEELKRIYNTGNDELFSFPFNFFGKKKNTKNIEIPNVEKAQKFNRPETSHHKRHAEEMGFDNQKEYEKAAISFFNSNRGKLYFSNARKRFYRYDEKTREFSVSSKGEIHTYMFKTSKKFLTVKLQDELVEV